MNIYKIKERYPTLHERCEYTRKKLKKIRQELNISFSNLKNNGDFSLITTGSYGRLEASDESDIDLFLIYDDDLDESTLEKITNILEGIIPKVVPVQAGSTGTFGIDTREKISNLVENIGGHKMIIVNLLEECFSCWKVNGFTIKISLKVIETNF